jgi:uncharacterized protein YqjF (DUF2071 family)
MNTAFNPPEHDPGAFPPGLVADWRDFVFLHFAVPPADLAPHVPFPLDLHEGRAFVSLVSFRLEGLRPGRGLPAAVGRWLLRPVSDHWFLNVRTYVRGPAGAGIHFIAEWIDNPLSLRLGPLTYGLPYMFAAMERRELPGSGLRRISVRRPDTNLATSLIVPATREATPRTAVPGSLDAFLLERYVAYTHRRGVSRWFAVEHPRWSVTPFQLARFDTALFDVEYPWWKQGTFVGGHLSDGFGDIAMSLPHRVAAPAFAPESTAEPAGAPAAAIGP